MKIGISCLGPWAVRVTDGLELGGLTPQEPIGADLVTFKLNCDCVEWPASRLKPLIVCSMV
ncbi:hypothetical protein SynA1562_00813 [Synechococcus sp. A15-62]|nr:hypothetical protein SynA1562_00813 [Synechococcus sp. A15-62]